MIYLASPYSHPLPERQDERYDAVCEFLAFHITRSREPIFSPVVYCHPISIVFDLPGHAKFWQNFNTAMLRISTQLWVLKLDGWQDSIGVEMEIKLATQLNITTRYFDANGAEVL